MLIGVKGVKTNRHGCEMLHRGLGWVNGIAFPPMAWSSPFLDSGAARMARVSASAAGTLSGDVFPSPGRKESVSGLWLAVPG